MKLKQFRINRKNNLNKVRPLAYFALIVGLIMMAVWIYCRINRIIPFPVDDSFENNLHFTVELCTSIMLIISGARVLFSNGEGEGMLLMSMGMLFYTCLNSIGYFSGKMTNSLIFLYFATLLTAIFLTVIAFHGGSHTSSTNSLNQNQK